MKRIVVYCIFLCVCIISCAQISHFGRKRKVRRKYQYSSIQYYAPSRSHYKLRYSKKKAKLDSRLDSLAMIEKIYDQVYNTNIDYFSKTDIGRMSQSKCLIDSSDVLIDNIDIDTIGYYSESLLENRDICKFVEVVSSVKSKCIGREIAFNNVCFYYAMSTSIYIQKNINGEKIIDEKFYRLYENIVDSLIKEVLRETYVISRGLCDDGRFDVEVHYIADKALIDVINEKAIKLTLEKMSLSRKKEKKIYNIITNALLGFSDVICFN